MTWHGRCGTIVVKFQYESPPPKKNLAMLVPATAPSQTGDSCTSTFLDDKQKGSTALHQRSVRSLPRLFFLFPVCWHFQNMQLSLLLSGEGKKITTTITVGVKRSCPALLGRLCIEGWIKHFGCPPKFADLVRLSLAVSKMRALQLYSPTSFHHVRCLYDLQWPPCSRSTGGGRLHLCDHHQVSFGVTTIVVWLQ